MDKRPSGRTVIAVIAIAAAILAFSLPGAFRIQMVASIGVLTANTVTNVIQFAGIACAVIAATLITMSVHQAIVQGRTAKQAELEAKRWDELPSRSESNPTAIEPMLQRVAKRYPEATQLVEITLEQLASVRQSLAKIDDILQANAGIITRETDRYGNVQFLAEGVLKGVCPGLVRIVYQAHEPDNSDTFVPDLIDVINIVNKENQIRVDATRKLANGVVYASTQGDTDSVLSQVKTATEKLHAPNEKEEWL